MNGECETKAAFSIGEAARAVGVSESTLKRWELQGQIKPMRVGNGCRIYTAQDIERLRSLKARAL
jgi:excisionase family DNA binding protein